MGSEIGRLYSNYARALLKEYVSLETDSVKADTSIPRGLRGELEAIADCVARAWTNPVRLPFSLRQVREAYNRGVVEEKTMDKFLREQFTPAHNPNADGSYPLIHRPTVYVDCEDKVIAWYLPSIFNADRSKQIFVYVQKARKLFRPQSSRDSWHEQGFANPKHCDLAPGNVILSPSCFAAGQDRDTDPGPSAPLKSANGPGRALMHDLAATNALIGSLLSLVHPELYDMQMSVLDALPRGRARATLEDILQSWTTPFSGLAITANSVTPFSGSRALPEIVAAFGEYAHGRFEVPLLGGRYIYNPGSVFILPGIYFEHGASRTHGERIFITSFCLPTVGSKILPDEYRAVGPPTCTTLMNKNGFPQLKEVDIWQR